ncbi:TPA: hypothetical protein HA244_04435 [Candidatus Micrarchaeota archaeon]|nr:hypothetical protein [Candidatus Micrarchaeota archaeon]
MAIKIKLGDEFLTRCPNCGKMARHSITGLKEKEWRVKVRCGKGHEYDMPIDRANRLVELTKGIEQETKKATPPRNFVK